MAKRVSNLYTIGRSGRIWSFLVIAGIVLVVFFKYEELDRLVSVLTEWWDGLGNSRQSLVALLVAVFALPSGYLRYIKPRFAKQANPPVFSKPNRFPFRVYNTNSLNELSSALECRHFDLPRSARLVQLEQRELESKLGDRLLLLTGRRGIGKTRECIELFRRLAEKKGEDITILHPRGEFDRPESAVVPSNFVPRTLILFIDEIETRCAIEDKGIAHQGQPVRTFHDRLAATIDWISDRQGARDWKVVLTASDEAEDLRKIDLSAGIFRKFTQIQLPAISPRLRRSFIANVARHFSISIDGDVLSYIASTSDGTPRGIIIPFAKRSSELDDRPGTMDLTYAKRFRFSYPSDWVSEVFEPLVSGHPERKAVFDAFATLRNYYIDYDKRIVDTLGASLLNKYPLDWINKRIISRTITGDLRAWIFNAPSDYYLCPAAYIRHSVDLEETLPALLKSIDAAARLGMPFEVVQPALPIIERTASKSSEAQGRVIRFLRTLSKRYPHAPQIWNSLSKLCSLSGRMEEAYTAARSAVLIDDGDIQSLIALAAVEERRGNIKSAIDAATRATQVGGDSDFAWLSLGVLLSKRGNNRDAIKALQRACEINSEGARNWFSLGIAYERAGLIEEAVDSCRRATEIEPSNFEGWHTLGIAYDRMGKFPESIDAIQQALKLKRTEPSLWFSLAWSLVRSGDKTSAVHVLQKAESLYSQDADKLAKISVAFTKAGDTARAESAALRALDIDPQNEVAKRCLAFNLLNSSTTVDQGLEKLRELAESTSSASDFCTLTSAFRRAGRLEQAVEAARRAVAIAPDDDRAKRSLAVSVGLHRPGSAEHVKLRQELARGSDATDDWVALSVAYGKAAQPEEAIEAARHALRTDPDNERAKRSLAINLEFRRKGFDENARLSEELHQLAASSAGVGAAILSGPEAGVGTELAKEIGLVESADLESRADEALRLREELADRSGSVYDWTALSIAYNKAGRRHDAVSAARRAVQIDPANKKARRSLATSLARKEPESAETRALLEELDSAATTSEELVAVSMAYSKASMFEHGVRAATRALQLDPSDYHAKRSLAINLANLNPGAQEAIELRQQVADASNLAEDWYGLGCLLGSARRFDEAAVALERALAISPAYEEAECALATNLANLPERVSEAIVIREKRCAHRGTAGDWTELSWAYGKAKRHSEAISAALRALALNPKQADAVKSLALNIGFVAELDDAVLNQVETAFGNGNTAGNWLQLAKYYGSSREPAKALEFANRAIALHEGSSTAWRLKALNLDALNRRDEADLAWREHARLSANAHEEPISEFLEKLEVNPYDKASWKVVFAHCIDSNDIEGANAHIRRLGRDSEVVKAMAVALADVMSLNFVTASSMLECLLELEIDNHYINHLIGTAKRKSGKPSEAIPFLEKSCHLSPMKPNYLYTLGLAFQDIDDQDRAKGYFVQALAADPYYRKASNALEELESS